MISAPLEVFCCYAREDREMLAHLKKHLTPLERQGQITIWSDTNLNAGVEWEKELRQHLESANIILLLISPDFMASDYCYSIEMGRAIARHNEGSAVVIPILLRSTFWQDAPFVKLQMVPTNTLPVTSWIDRDSALHNITTQINRVVSKFRTKRMQVDADKHTLALGQQTLLLGSGGSSSSRRGRPFHGWRIFLGLLIVCLILGGSVAAIRIWGDSSHATITTQTCQRGTATPFVASSYDIAVAKSGIQFGFNAQHTRTNSYEHILNPDNVWKLQQKWACLLGSDLDSSPPAVADGLVYVGTDSGKLYAFDASTGQPKWVASTKGVIDSSPAVANGFVYVGSQDGKLYAFDASTGQPKWSALTGAIHDSSPAVANYLVYVGSWENHSLDAFDASTGQLKWVASTGDAIYSSPIVANGFVYVGSFDGKLYAFDAATGGQPKWSAFASSAPGKQGIDSSPAVANGFVYIGSRDGKLYAFSLP